MFQRILVPLDGSERAQCAIPVAARLARASGGSVILVRVVLPPADFGKYAAHHSTVWERKAYENERAEAASSLVSAMLTHASDLIGINTEMGVAGGLVPPTICSLANNERADLIVMCSRGETGFNRWLFGSVAQEVARQSSVPVLVLNERGVSLPTLRTSGATGTVRALVALDGSPQSEAVLEPVAQLVSALAAPFQGVLHLMNVVDLPSPEGKGRGQAHIDTLMHTHARQEAETYLQAVADRLQAGPLAKLKLAITSSVVAHPDVAGTLINHAEHHIGKAAQVEDYTLIALAAHQRKGLHRLLPGNVTERLLRSARLPILIARPREKAARVHARAKEKRTFGVGGN